MAVRRRRGASRSAKISEFVRKATAHGLESITVEDARGGTCKLTIVFANGDVLSVPKISTAEVEAALKRLKGKIPALPSLVYRDSADGVDVELRIQPARLRAMLTRKGGRS